MAIGKALEFVKKAMEQPLFRDYCLELNNRLELMEEFDFSESEFEDAINMNLVKCGTYEEAEGYKHIKMWFFLI